MINTAQLLKYPSPAVGPALRDQVITHRRRPGFIERQDGSWLHLPTHVNVQTHSNRRANKPKARRRLWHWLTAIQG